MNPMQNGQQNPYQSQMHQGSRMMGMSNMQHMNQQYQMMNNMNNMNQMQQMMMMRQQQQTQRSQQQQYNNYRSNQIQNNMHQSNMQQNMRNNMQNMSMNVSGNRSNHNTSNNQHNNGSNNTQQSNNATSNANKGPTKDTWISPFKNRDQNIDFFMYAYKCQSCPLRRNCQSKVTCPGWHHEGEKRRNPGEDPNFLYSEEPCPNVKPQGSNKWQPPSRCTDGDECGYSHTLLEQMYHPNIYKTSMCINFTNPQGNKCQWGFYCTHAHGQDDIRNPNKKQSASNDKETTPPSIKKEGTPTKDTPTNKDKRARSVSDAPNMYNMYQSHGYNYNTSPQRVRADFSPLPFQATAAKQYANPPPLHLHNYQHNYHTEQSYMAYHQTQNRKRSISADTGLVPYMPSKASQQPNMYHRYRTHDLPSDLPDIHPVMDASRVSLVVDKTNTSTPPPPTAVQAKAKSFLNGDVHFYSRTRSMSAVAGHYVDPLVTQSKVSSMAKLQASSSLPSHGYPSKVPPLPSDETKAYYFAKAPAERQRRGRSESEPLPLPPLPNGEYMVNGSSNPNPNNSLSSDPFKTKRLTSIPDNNTTLISPNALNIDNIMTPRDIMSPDAMQQPNEADWRNYFGFNKEVHKKIDVPPTPTPPLPTDNKEEQINRLRKELDDAAQRIQILSNNKKKEIESNDDEKEKETDIEKQQLLRYKHFITCPSCNIFDPSTPRNHVLIPCGHLVCGKCSSHTKHNHKCPLCDVIIQNYQVLLIG